MTFVLAGTLLGLSHPAKAADVYAIIANTTNVPRPVAWIDAAFDTRGAPEGTEVRFLVTDVIGHQIAEFVLPLNANGFVSTLSAAPPYNDLYTISQYRPALVRVRAPAGPQLQSAVLHQNSRRGHSAMNILPSFWPDDVHLGIGTLFSMALGPTTRATLLVANVSGVDAVVDVFRGTQGCLGCGEQGILRLTNRSLWIVDIDPAVANSHVVLHSTGDIVAQLVLEIGNNRISQVALLPFAPR